MVNTRFLVLVFASIMLLAGFLLSGGRVLAITSTSTSQMTITTTSTIEASSTPLEKVGNGITAVIPKILEWVSRINFKDIGTWFKETTGKSFSEAFEFIKTLFVKLIGLGTVAIDWIITKLGFSF